MSLGAVLALGAGSAVAAPTWLPPEDIAGPTATAGSFPDLAVNAEGDAMAIWPRSIGGETVVEAIERRPDGGWSAPVPLSDPSEEEGAMLVHVALDAAGNAVAVWRALGAFGYVIRTATRPAGGEWSQPEDLSPTETTAEAPDLAGDAAGNVVAVWAAFDGTDTPIWAATRSAGGDWSQPAPISADEEDGFAPRVAIDAAGNAVAVWQRLLPSVEDPIRAAVRPAGGGWAEPEDVSVAGEDGRAPRIAVDAAGAAVAAWADAEGANASVHAAARPAGGDWAGPEAVSAGGESTGEPEVAIDQAGTAFAVWPAPEGGERILRSAALPVGGGWSSPEPISGTATRFNSYGLTIGGPAGVVAAWTREDGSGHEVQAAVRPTGGSWGEPENLSTAGVDSGIPKLGFDAEGNAIAVWGWKKATNEYFLQGSGYDFAGPRLDALRIPARGTVGDPVRLSVSPFDIFGLGATSWGFGDGAGAGGTAVSHIYGAPGGYPVTVTALDANGNASRQTRTIEIAAGPNPPPPPRLALSLRLGRESLARLLRTGKLAVRVEVNGAASVLLTGRARLKSHARGRARSRLVPVFVPKRARFAAAGERKLQLRLSKRGRRALRPLHRVRLAIAGTARAANGAKATRTAARTLR